ncbi:hypothetical protein RB195_000190 [Necator americanus]|uniref:FERM domain-containing protein n=1 Tax=Necator americanus TaxID=51031 RepID=A0ABR1D9J9_NECAM
MTKQELRAYLLNSTAKYLRPLEVVAGLLQEAVVGYFFFNFAFDDVIRSTVDQCPVDIALAPSGCPLTDLEYAIFMQSSKLQHGANLVSKLAEAYRLRLYLD